MRTTSTSTSPPPSLSITTADGDEAGNCHITTSVLPSPPPPPPPPPPPGPTCCRHYGHVTTSAPCTRVPLAVWHHHPLLSPCTQVPLSLRPHHQTAARQTVGWGEEGGPIKPPLPRYFFFLFFFLFRGPAAYAIPAPRVFPFNFPISRVGACVRLVFFFWYISIFVYIVNILRYYYTEKPMRLIKWVPATPARAL
jgi:hypothetical protein